MSALTDHCETVRQWMNWGADEYPDSLIITFVRMGEELINQKLRIADQVLTSSPLTITSDGVNYTSDLPADWLESDFVHVIDGDALEYKSRNDFFTKDTNTGDYENSGKFTTIGRKIYVAGDVPLTAALEVMYFAQVPVLDNPTWLSTKYTAMNLMATLLHAGMYYIEEDRTAAWGTFVDDKIEKLNAAYKMSQPSGARITAKSKRTFG